MSRALTIFFGLLALGVLAYICIGHHRGQIQDEVAANASAQLTAGGFGFAQATADGQHVTLTGTAPSASVREAAGQAALAAVGVVAVENLIAVETLVPPPGPDPTPVITPASEGPFIAADMQPETDMQPEADAATIEPQVVEPVPESLQVVLDSATRRADVVGLVLNPALGETRKAELGEQIAAALPGWNLNDGTTATANVPTEMSGAVQRLLPVLVRAESARLDADAQGIRIDAKLGSFAERSALQAQLDEFAAAPLFAGRNLSWILDSPPPTSDGCQSAFDELLDVDSILFTTSKAEIRTSSFVLLDKLVRVARDCDVSVSIEGHTDSRGPPEFNDYLSLERARSVRQYLITNGVDRERISARGFGSAKPIADNNTVNGRQRNRRIEFRVIRTES